MKLYQHIDEFEKRENAVVTIGTFDGVHLGHQQIIHRLKELAAQSGGETVILTFFPHPRMILHPEQQDLKLISTMPEKAELLRNLGIDHLIITPFSRDFSNQSPEDYIRDVLINKIGTKTIVIGYDHRYGKDRSGGLAQMQEFRMRYGYEVEEISEQDVHDVAVSSTKIRHAILQGEIGTANAFLGYKFFLNGKVIRGDQIGRTLGYPTANIFVPETYKLIPGDGIYAVTVAVSTQQSGKSYQPVSDLETPDSRLPSSGSSFKGMAYIGHRPTINGMTRNIEVNIFDFDGDIYDHQIRMDFHAFIRGDVRFNSLDELTVQLGKDKDDVLRWFGEGEL
ncbi:MAG: bifunctional riboflavin kinase/FAD synthetase [Mucilaginibacter polytrichastri]|nr:bifunctional riboflavin kinase/FAD synthetase [Mucilaginibacter polytrichastri]